MNDTASILNHDNNNNNNNKSNGAVVVDTKVESTSTTAVAAPAAAVSSSSSVLPHWHIPQPTNVSFPITGLKMYNSLTRQKELFIPMNGTKQITWYMYVIVAVIGCAFVCMVECVW
jgi:hypothetical protein